MDIAIQWGGLNGETAGERLEMQTQSSRGMHGITLTGVLQRAGIGVKYSKGQAAYVHRS